MRRSNVGAACAKSQLDSLSARSSFSSALPDSTGELLTSRGVGLLKIHRLSRRLLLLTERSFPRKFSALSALLPGSSTIPKLLSRLTPRLFAPSLSSISRFSYVTLPRLLSKMGHTAATRQPETPANVGTPNAEAYYPFTNPPSGTALRKEDWPQNTWLPLLFSPITIGNVALMEFKNRLWTAPLCQYSCEPVSLAAGKEPGREELTQRQGTGLMNAWHLVHLGAMAVRGAGLVLTEASAVLPNGRISPEDVGIWSDEHTEAFKPVVNFIKANGARAGIQLAHAGRKVSLLSVALVGFELTSSAGEHLGSLARRQYDVTICRHSYRNRGSCTRLERRLGAFPDSLHRGDLPRPSRDVAGADRGAQEGLGRCRGSCGCCWCVLSSLRCWCGGLSPLLQGSTFSRITSRTAISFVPRAGSL